MLENLNDLNEEYLKAIQRVAELKEKMNSFQKDSFLERAGSFFDEAQQGKWSSSTFECEAMMMVDLTWVDNE